MFSIRRAFRDWLYADNTTCKVVPGADIVRESETLRSDPTLNFRVFNAVGGKVVEFNRYDRQTDKQFGATYIIKDTDNFGETIAKIAAMEIIKS